MKRLKNTCGMWCLRSGREDTPIPELTRIAAEQLDWLIDGFEYHYPFELNEDNFADVQSALGNDKDVFALGLGTFANPEFYKGAFVHPDGGRRKRNIDITRRCIDLASELKAQLIIWPGREGYTHPFETDYDEIWRFFFDGLAEIVEYATNKGVPVLLEPSASKPPMTLIMKNIGVTLLIIRKLAERGVGTSNVKVNMDWEHLRMSEENLAEYASLLAKEGLLGHQHANAGWNAHGDYHIVGSSFFMETLELACQLQDIGYGTNGERMGFDIVPFNEDSILAMKRSIIQWEFIYELASQIDRARLRKAREQRSAAMAQEVVYAALGLDELFLKKIESERKGL